MSDLQLFFILMMLAVEPSWPPIIDVRQDLGKVMENISFVPLTARLPSPRTGPALSSSVTTEESCLFLSSYGRTGIQVSALGFGVMRMPIKDGHMERELAIPLPRRGMELAHGMLG